MTTHHHRRENRTQKEQLALFQKKQKIQMLYEKDIYFYD